MRRYRNPARQVAGGISGGIILIGLVLAFAFGRGDFFLPIFFIFLAVAVFIGSLSSLNPRGIYGGLIGAMWMIMLALFFITGSWLWFLVGAAVSAILGALARPIMAALLGMGLFGMASMMNNQQQPYYQPTPQQPQQPYYQPTQQSQEQSHQPYQEGYQPPPQQPPQPEVYREGGQQHQYPAQYDQPQAQYPQQQPPQQQQ